MVFYSEAFKALFNWLNQESGAKIERLIDVDGESSVRLDVVDVLNV